MPGPQPRIFAVILAAGRSRRFGATKQARLLGDLSLVERAQATARAACGGRVVTVLGHDWQAVLEAGDRTSGFIVLNDDFKDGMATSIATAARAVAAHADALVLILADQPLVDAAHLQALIAHWSGDPLQIVATAFAGRDGPPVLFPSGAFADLCELEGDRGAQDLLRSARYDVRRVTFEAAATDIDTPADLQSLQHDPAQVRRDR